MYKYSHLRVAEKFNSSPSLPASMLGSDWRVEFRRGEPQDLMKPASRASSAPRREQTRGWHTWYGMANKYNACWLQKSL